MKIAMCYYGYAYNMTNIKNTTANDTVVNYNITLDNHMDTLIKPNNMDIFVHSWSIDSKDNIINDYK